MGDSSTALTYSDSENSVKWKGHSTYRDSAQVVSSNMKSDRSPTSMDLLVNVLKYIL